MLNPSTADANQDDPTLRRCLDFSKRWGYASLEVVNLFALRSPDPYLLGCVADPVGPDNDEWLQAAVERADRVVVAWGANGQKRVCERARKVFQTIRYKAVWCLGVAKSGAPRHPLMVRKGTKLRRWPSDASSGW